MCMRYAPLANLAWQGRSVGESRRRPMNKMWAYLADDGLTMREKVKETWAGAHPRGSSRCIYPSLSIWMSFLQRSPLSLPFSFPSPCHSLSLSLFICHFLCFSSSGVAWGGGWQKSKIWNWNYAALATFIVACISRCAWSGLAGKTPKYAPN